MADNRRGFLKKGLTILGGSLLGFSSKSIANPNFNLEEEVEKWHDYFFKRVFDLEFNQELSSEEFYNLKPIAEEVAKRKNRFPRKSK